MAWWKKLVNILYIIPVIPIVLLLNIVGNIIFVIMFLLLMEKDGVKIYFKKLLAFWRIEVSIGI